MQKIKGGEITCETYLDLVDDFKNDEEYQFPVQMSLFEEDLDVVVPQPVTLAPPSTCQINENQMRRKTNEICRINKR